MRSVPGTKTASIWVSGLLVVCAGVTGAFLGANRKAPVRPTEGTSSDEQKISAAIQRLPLTFQENRGQSDKSVRFLTRGAGYTFWMSPTSTTLALAQLGKSAEQAKAGMPVPASMMRMRMVGANPKAKMTGAGERQGTTNYLIGRDKRKWVHDVPNFTRVRYQGIYNGVDLEYYGSQQELEHDFIVKPGAKPDAIRLAYDGVKNAEITADGELHLNTVNGVVEQKRPYSYQMVNGKRKTVESSYVLLAKNEVAFSVGDYDQTKPLVIDPVLRYSTFIGGSVDDYGFDIAIDSSRNVYITGYTGSYAQAADNRPTAVPVAEGGGFAPIPQLNAFPVEGGGAGDIDGRSISRDLSTPRNGSIDGTWNYSLYDAFVTKVNPNGNGLVFSTYLGSESDDYGMGIAVGPGNTVFVTGRTNSLFWPLLFPVQANSGGGSDSFLVKLNANGNGFVYSTYLGGSGFDQGRSIAVDNTGNAYVAGVTSSNDFPVFQAAQPTLGGGMDAYVASINASGSTFNYSTYLGGSGNEGGTPTAFGNSELTYIAEGNFPWVTTIPGGHGQFPDIFTPFVTQLGVDYTVDVAVDGQSNAYVTGGTNSTVIANFPSPNAVQPANAGGYDAFVIKYGADGSRTFSTFLGGTGDEAARSIAVDHTGAAYLTGWTSSTAFPTTAGALQTDQGGTDAFVTKLSGTGEALIYSTYLGGGGVDIGNGIAVSSGGQAYITGTTTSNAPEFPTVNFSQANRNNARDMFATKLRPNGLGYEYSTFVGGTSGFAGDDRGMSIVVDDRGQAYIAGMTASYTFPVTINSYDPSINAVTNWYGTSSGGVGDYPRMDAFVTKLHSPPFAPSDLTTTDVQQTSISLAWTDNSDNEDGFEIERRLANGGNWAFVGAVGQDQVTFTSTGLVPTTLYQFRVRGYNSDGVNTYYGPYSNQLTVSTLPEEPDTPTNFTAVALDTTRIRVTWVDRADNEDSYILERRQLPGGVFMIINGGDPLPGSSPATQTGGTMQFVDTGLTPVTTYEYRLRARNVAGDSAVPFPTAQATTLSPAPTAEPVVTATPVSNSAIDLSWTFPVTPTDPIGFKIYRKSSVDASFTLIRTTSDQNTTFTDTGLSANTEYCYRVRAYNAAGDGPLSSPVGGVCATTLPDPPAAPSALTATLQPPTSVRLDWTDNSQSPDEDGFKIEASTDAFGTQQNTTLSSAAAAGDATISVASTAGIAASRLLRIGNEILFVTGVSGNTVTVLRGQLETTAAGHAASSIIRVGTVQLTSEAPQHVGTGSVSPGLVVTGLLNNTVYHFRVRSFARNMTGDSDSTPSQPASVITRPADPSALTVTTPAAPAGSSSLLVSWTDNNPRTNTASTFLVERAPESTPGSGTPGMFAAVSTVPTGTQGGAWTLTDTGLAANSTYYYRVSATNVRPAGTIDPNSGGSSAVIGPVSGTTRPAAPTLNSVVEIAPTTHLRLTWTDNSPVKTQIRIERSTDSTFNTGVTTVRTAAAGETTWDDTSTAGNVTYYYRLTAFNGVGDSAPSSIGSRLTLPGQPQNLNGQASDDPNTAARIQINLTWASGSANPTAYRVEVSSTGPGGNYTAVPGSPTGVGATSLRVGNLNPAIEYCFRVRGTNATGDGENSSVACPPAGPAALTATVVSDTQIRLNWEDHSSTESDFLIERVQGVSFATGTVLPSRNTGGPNITTYLDSGLTPNTTYTYRVTALGMGGTSVPSREAGATTLRTAPASATDLTATPISATQVNLTWSHAGGNLSGFTLERSTDSAFPNGNTTSFNLPASPFSYSDTGLMANVTYYYRLTAVNGTSKAAPTSAVSALTFPAAPSNLVATAISASRIDLTWTDNSAVPTDFEIDRKEEPAGSFAPIGVTTAPGTSYSDTTGLQPGTTYTYRVRATNATGDSANSAEASATTLPSKPNAPSGLQVSTVSQTSLRLTWTDNSNNETGFKIERSPNGSNGWRQIGTAGQDAVAYLDQGLLAETTYYYRVSSTNAGGDSTPSNVASATTLPNLPAAPGSLSVTVPTAPDGSTKLTLNWSDASGNESGFKVERSTDNFVAPANTTLVTTTAANVTTFTDTGRTPDTIYYYRVRATNTAGDSANTNIASGRTLVAAPSAPSGLTVRPLSSSSLRVDWTDTSNNEDGFKLERSTDNANFVQIATPAAGVATYTDTGLAADTRYYYRVRATNGGGDSAVSNTANAKTFVTAPAAPTNLVATALSSTSIGLTWSDSSTETGYRIERKVVGGTFALVQTVGANVLTFTDTGLAIDTTYVYRVFATNPGGDSAPSNESTARTLPLTPTAPSGLTASAISATQIRLNWTDASNNETGFKIERSTDGTNWSVVDTVGMSVVSFTDSGLAPNTSYTYRVRATNAGGDSAPSNQASAQTFPVAPGAPQSFTATALSQTSVELSWSPGSGVVTGFKLERKLEGGTYEQIQTPAAGATSAIDNDVVGGTTYVYRIRATNASGDSPNSNEATVLTLPNLPGAPSNVTVTALSSSSLKVDWTDNSSDETGFEIERTGGAGPAVVSTVGANVTTFTSTGLAATTTYTYKVRATGNNGPSSWSTSASGTTLIAVPGAPSSLTVTVHSLSTLALNWTDTSSTETGFRIERRDGTNNATPFVEVGQVGANVTSWLDTTVEANQTYTYRVKAINAGGDSAPSNEASVLLAASGRLQVSVKSISFGKLRAGQTKTKNFKIKNTGRSSLQGNVETLSTPFRIVSGGGSFVLAPGKSVTVKVEFAPTEAGRATQTLKITSTDEARQAVNVSLTGNGTAARGQ